MNNEIGRVDYFTNTIKSGSAKDFLSEAIGISANLSVVVHVHCALQRRYEAAKEVSKDHVIALPGRW